MDRDDDHGHSNVWPGTPLPDLIRLDLVLPGLGAKKPPVLPDEGRKRCLAAGRVDA